MTTDLHNGIYCVHSGEIKNINELNKTEYEEFLELMHKLRIAYMILVNHENPKIEQP